MPRNAAPAKPPAEPVRPLRRDAERNRLKILDAAGNVFARHGLDATMDQIADEAGVGIATMYRRFPDKQVLIETLFEERVERIVRIAEEALTFSDAWRGLVHFMERTQEMFTADLGLVDAVFDPNRPGPEKLAKTRERIGPLSEELLRRAQEQGRMRPDLEATDLPLLQLMISLIVRITSDVSPAIWARFLGLVLDGLRSNRRLPSPLPVPALTPKEFDEAFSEGRFPQRRSR